MCSLSYDWRKFMKLIFEEVYRWFWYSYSIISISRKSSVKFSKAATKYKLIPKKPASATNRKAAFNWMFNAEYRNNTIYSKIDSSRKKYLNHVRWIWFNLIFCYLLIVVSNSIINLHHFTWISEFIFALMNTI